MKIERLILLKIVDLGQKPKSTIAVIKVSLSNEEFLQTILGREEYGALHRLQKAEFATLTSSDDGNWNFFGRDAYRSHKDIIES